MSLRGAFKLQGIETRIAERTRDCERLTTFIVKRPESESLLGRLDEAEREIAQLRLEAEQERSVMREKAHFLTRDEVEARIGEAVLHLARTSSEFSALMRRMFPDFVMIPVQALETLQVRPRVKLVLPTHDCTAEQMTMVIDAFDPPQQIRFATECARLKAEHPGWTLVQIGLAVGIGKKATGEALKYAQLMVDRGTTDPYRELHDEPQRASRWKTGRDR